jgi:predicted Zn-dependent protease
MTSDESHDGPARTAAAVHRGDAIASVQYAEAITADPANAALLNSAGADLAGRGQSSRAFTYFRRAVIADPSNGEAAINAAIMLSRLERHSEAVAWLAEREEQLGMLSRYWSSRAAAERDAKQLVAAARSYDRCLAIDPGHLLAQHGRARVALERGEDDMVALFQRALAGNNGDAELWLGIAQALDCQGDSQQAEQVARLLCNQAPQWTDALELLAQLRWAKGDRESFTDHFDAAIAARPGDSALPKTRARLLAGVDRYAEAADIAERAAKVFPDDPQFNLIAAVHAGEAGDDDRAEVIFAALKLNTLERRLHEARHWLRRGLADRAEMLLSSIVAEDHQNIGAWALRDIAWRMLGDDRQIWLHGQDGLVQMLNLELDDSLTCDLVAALNGLHEGTAVPVGQSVREGTQTRGSLLDRHETIFASLRAILDQAIEHYRQRLPAADDTHPLLRHRDAPLSIAGSWSIRLAKHGYHTSHIHPKGLISSAAYLIVPDASEECRDTQAGWLELGRPPADLRLSLSPLFALQPSVGKLALFPSTLYHGTRKFDHGRRMTVAFDVAREKS